MVFVLLDFEEERIRNDGGNTTCERVQHTSAINAGNQKNQKERAVQSNECDDECACFDE